MENLDPPPLPPSPNIKDEKMARFALRVASWGWGFAVLLICPRLQMRRLVMLTFKSMNAIMLPFKTSLVELSCKAMQLLGLYQKHLTLAITRGENKPILIP